jgi:hypothetical protein
MAFNDTAMARQLDFGGEGVRPAPRIARDSRRGLRLAVPSAVLRGPDKYTVLEHRRRQAQIKARRAVDAAGTLDFEC